MKTLILLFILLLSCSSSDSKTVNDDLEYHHIGKYGRSGYPMDVGKLFIDGCMYIVIEGQRETSITHAGNCPNQIHRLKD